MKYHIQNEREAHEFAKKLAKNVIKPSVFCFFGDLGAGKTSFCREFIRFLVKNSNLNVPSPTFTLVQVYENDDFPIFHFDLYRLENAEEIYELGWDDAIHNGVVLIEWPERIQDLLPQHRTDITITICDEDPDARYIQVEERH